VSEWLCDCTSYLHCTLIKRCYHLPPWASQVKGQQLCMCKNKMCVMVKYMWLVFVWMEVAVGVTRVHKTVEEDKGREINGCGHSVSHTHMLTKWPSINRGSIFKRAFKLNQRWSNKLISWFSRAPTAKKQWLPSSVPQESFLFPPLSLWQCCQLLKIELSWHRIYTWK